MMNNTSVSNSRHSFGWWLSSLLWLLGSMLPAYAHQTPSTIVLLDITPDRVMAELQLPLSELELSFGYEITKDPDHLINSFGPQLEEYLKAHIHPFVTRDNPWLVEIADMKVEEAEQMVSGPPFQEIIVHLVLIPPAGVGTRKFIFDYDVVMHQVINHTALVSIRSDWELGKTNEHITEAGVIRVDTKTNLIYPLEISLHTGSWWTGFKSMVSLGMQHIKEGTDHLLFLLVLLLPATLIVDRKHWGQFGGTRYSISKLFGISTAFTIGHSVTLLLGALEWLQLPSQPVEVLIALSILISAIHAVRPIFPGKETYVAIGFGLVHGLAFAAILVHLNLNAVLMTLSILGFNIGIELMQLFIIMLVVPWLILLSHTSVYKVIRISGAIVAGMAASAWIAERILGRSNTITDYIQTASPYAPWAILVLAVVSLLAFGWHQSKTKGFLKFR